MLLGKLCLEKEKFLDSEIFNAKPFWIEIKEIISNLCFALYVCTCTRQIISYGSLGYFPDYSDLSYHTDTLHIIQTLLRSSKQS